MSDFYSDLAAELRRIAGDVETLAGRELPALSYVELHVQPASASEDDQIAAVDAFGQTLLGKSGEPRRMPSGSYHHEVKGLRWPVRINALCGITSPEQRAEQQALAELEAEVERLRAELLATQPPEPEGGEPDAS